MEHFDAGFENPASPADLARDEQLEVLLDELVTVAPALSEDFAQRLGHLQAGGVEWSPLIIVENATDRRAVGEHHAVG